MKVLHLIETLDFGGAEKVVVDLVTATREQCTPVVCCTKHAGELARALPDGVEVIVLGQGEGAAPGLAWRVARLLREGGFEALHTHLWGVYLVGALAGRLAGVPVVHTVHGNYLHYGEGRIARLKKALRQGLERRLAAWHHRITTVSETLARQLTGPRGFPPDRVETVHNGIDERRTPPAPARAADVPVRLLTVGRLAAVKHQALMLRALDALRRERPGVALHLCLVGDGPERPALEALTASLGLQDLVEFAGFRHDVADLLADADVFLMSSRYEGISIAVLEAMRAGLPVIGTAVGGMPETVQAGHTGWLVPDGDEAAYVQALREALDDPTERRARGAAGRARQAEHFSVHRAASRYLALYRGEGAAA